jgi:4-hydroxybenzoate polyprenyltransferase
MNRVRAYAQLVRLPNVFTALADICIGVLAMWASTAVAAKEWWLRAACLLGASACLYSAGMVWNDVFDLQQDRRERPNRPLPSGRIRLDTAARLGSTFVAAGLVFAVLAGWNGSDWDWTPPAIAIVLTASILLYDGWLKRTWAGPIGMGACRFLNVLLGLSLGRSVLEPWGLHAATIVGTYIVGVTWFARTEAGTSRRTMLAGAALLTLLALLMALPLPTWFPPGTSSPLFVYMLVGVGFLVGLPMHQAIMRRTPALVQAAVKRAILCLITLDAALAAAVVGTIGLLILLLLVPASLLGRWIYST